MAGDRATCPPASSGRIATEIGNSPIDELDRAADPSYTVDTLEALRVRLGAGPRSRLLIGADNLRILDKWKTPARIIELAERVVVVRPTDTMASLPRGYKRQD